MEAKIVFVLLALLTIAVEVPSVTGQKDICRLPKKEGPCYAYIPRWFYNWKTRKCEKFIYGGCDGNENNFKTQGECEKRCARSGSDDD